MQNRIEEGNVRGSQLAYHVAPCGRTLRYRTGHTLPGARLALVLLAMFITACASGGDADSDGDPDIQAGQITRPASSGLPLSDPQAVQAYDRADQFLIDWFFRRDIDAALTHISADLRPAIQPLLEGTNVEGECFLTQVDGSQPDTSGVVLARYAIRDCQISPPDTSATSHIKIGVTIADQNAWVTEVQFE